MTSVDFYGGVDEIGGNKILVDDTNTSFFFDFGMSFSQANKYLAEFLQPRKCNGILDFVQLGLLPKLKGIYREDYLRHCGLNCDSTPSVDGVLISQAHMDHSAYIHHLREDIPIYATEESFLILKALEETSVASFNEPLNLKKSFTFVPMKKGGYTRPQKSIKVERDIRKVKPYKKFEIGDFSIKSAPVDHSLPGASAYMAESGEETIVYTGDLRFHGRNAHLTEKFVKEAKKAAPTILVSEGTRIDQNENISEEEIEKNAINEINDHKGHVIVNFPVRDLDRLSTFYNVACETDRTLVVSLKQAYLLNLFYNRGYPKIDDIAVYKPRKKWGLIGDSHFACYEDEWLCSHDIDPVQLSRDYSKWEHDFLDWDNTVSYLDIKEEPEDYIFRCDFFELKELIDIKPENGIYIKSSTEPFDEQMEINEEKVKNWLELFNLPMKKGGFHASGHANGKEILDMIIEIAPEKVYPVHTDHKERFDVLEDEGIEVVYPKVSNRFEIRSTVRALDHIGEQKDVNDKV